MPKTYKLEVAEEELQKAGVGLHTKQEFSDEDRAQDDVTGADLDPQAVRATRGVDM